MQYRMRPESFSLSVLGSEDTPVFTFLYDRRLNQIRWELGEAAGVAVTVEEWNDFFTAITLFHMEILKDPEDLPRVFCSEIGEAQRATSSNFRLAREDKENIYSASAFFEIEYSALTGRIFLTLRPKRDNGAPDAVILTGKQWEGMFQELTTFNQNLQKDLGEKDEEIK